MLIGGLMSFAEKFCSDVACHAVEVLIHCKWAEWFFSIIVLLLFVVLVTLAHGGLVSHHVFVLFLSLVINTISSSGKQFCHFFHQLALSSKAHGCGCRRWEEEDLSPWKPWWWCPHGSIGSPPSNPRPEALQGNWNKPRRHQTSSNHQSKCQVLASSQPPRLPGRDSWYGAVAGSAPFYQRGRSDAPSTSSMPPTAKQAGLVRWLGLENARKDRLLVHNNEVSWFQARDLIDLIHRDP